MVLEIRAIGGYNEVGRNMTLVSYNSEHVILDMGIHVENYIKFTEDKEDLEKISVRRLADAEAIPKINDLKDYFNDVKAIIPTHAHLDHIGAIPFLAHKFKAPVYCTPFTRAVIKRILKDEKIQLNNKIITVNVNSKQKVSENIEVEFVNITHSAPQSTLVIVKTPEGNIGYANDFKLDNYPVLGKAPNYKLLKKLKVKILIIDSLYVDEPAKTPPEESVRLMLKDLFQNIKDSKKLMIITTFSSHIARITSIVKESKVLKRKILFLGRSLEKYIKAAESCGFEFKKVEILRFGKQIRRKLKEVNEKPGKWLIICTGHQGEPKSILSRMADDDLKIDLEDANVIFSCKTIPTPTNIHSRKILEEKLRSRKARIIKDIHVSGHGGEEDIRELLEMLEPEIVVPAHSSKVNEFKDKFRDYNVKILNNGDDLTIWP